MAKKTIERGLEGTTLHWKGEAYDLSLYDGQQHRQEGSGAVVYEFTQNGVPAQRVPVDGIFEAHELERLCNPLFRGW